MKKDKKQIKDLDQEEEEYGDEGEDITDDVLNYINKKYGGKK